VRQTAKPLTSARNLAAGPHADVFYLWLLLALELIATGWLRHWSRAHHGG